MIIASFLLLFPPSNLYSYKILTHALKNNPNDVQCVKRHEREMDLDGESGTRKGGTGKIGMHWLHIQKYNKTHY